MTKASPKTIGAFVVGGVALLLAGIVTFGSFKFFEKRLPVVMYFEGDLSGLDVGAPLVFRGVRIGTVTDVTMYYNTTTQAFRIPVHAEIEADRFVIEGQLQGGRNIPQLIENGLRAQLATQSMLTGKMLISLDMEPGTPVRLVRGDAAAIEIPTIPSAMEQLQAGVEGLLKKLQEMPLAELTQDLRSLVRDTDDAVRRLDVKNFADAGAQAAQAMQEVRELIANVGRRIDTLAPIGEATLKDADKALVELHSRLAEARGLIANMQRAAESADRLMTTANGVIEPGSATYRELISTLREFSNMARSIRGLADDLERNPDSILFGKASAGRPK